MRTLVGDLVGDRLATIRKIRILTTVDTFSRFSPAGDPRSNYRGEDVVQALERICRKVGYPKSIRGDQVARSSAVTDVMEPSGEAGCAIHAKWSGHGGSQRGNFSKVVRKRLPITATRIAGGVRVVHLNSHEQFERALNRRQRA